MDLAEDPGATIQADLRALSERSASRAAAKALKARYAVYAGAGLYAVLFSAAALVSYLAFDGARFDLGNMAQAIWSTSHGHFLRVTADNLDVSAPTVHEMVRLGAHVDPFLVLLVPFWWIFGSPLMLLILQAIAVATGALPVFWLARKHLRDDQAAASFAFAYLLYPATQFNAFTKATGFHPVSFAVPLILFAIWFLDEERLLPFVVFGLLAASTKEEIPVAVGCLGIWYAVRKGKRVPGLGIFTVGLVVSLVDFLVVIPHFSPTGEDPFAGRYTDVGGTPGGILHKLVTDPGAMVHAVASGHKAVYLVLLLGPFLGWWLREPLLFLGAIPDLAINLLSSKGLQTSIGYQYTAGIVPFVIAASIFGVAKAKRDPGRASISVLAGAAALAFILSPVRLAFGELNAARPSNPVHAAKAHALDLIPATSAVSASNELGGYLSARRFIYVFPALGKARWVIVDVNDQTEMPRDVYLGALRRIGSNEQWKLVYARNGVEVLHRRVAS
jgi:uncharacterized membrane protein